jgi:CMP-N,N'-diacetyllegionaminic acid synthase
MKTLYLVTARGGSKGIPGKNIKPLAGKPLIHYSLEYARLFAEDKDICLSTDSEEIIKVAEQIGYKTPFIRPDYLAADSSGSYGVIVHALNHYKEQGENFDNIVLLQPTSPLRLKRHLDEAMDLYSESIDMVVSVEETHLYHFYEEKEGLLIPFGRVYTRRQDAPVLYRHNGSIYIFNTKSIENHAEFNEFTRVRKYVMPENFSIDIDTPEDWKKAEYFILIQK